MTSIEGAPAAMGATPPGPAGPEKDVRGGVLAALGAYGMWGAFPLFFKLLEGVDAVSIVANRIVFSLIFVGVILYVSRRFGEITVAFRSRRTVITMAISTILLAINWLIFIWAVDAGRVLEVSFGYFINPLVNVAIGMVLLGERQNRMQTIAIAIAVIAVLIQAVGVGGLPWIALSLASSFGFYGFFRKTVDVGSAPGLFVETLLMLPLALGYIGYTIVIGAAAHYADPFTAFNLVLTGPLTAMALIFFAYAARQLRLTAIGMFQYIAPSFHFLSAVFLFGETLTPVGLVSFALIWLSLVIFSYDSWTRRSRPVRQPRAA